VSWFNNNKRDDITQPGEMSPLEAVTHLMAAIQLSDQQTGFEERESWLRSMAELFPDFSNDRAENYINDAYRILKQQSTRDRKIYVTDVLNRINKLMNHEQLVHIGKIIAHLIESDGIVLSSELEMAELISNQLGIKIEIKEDD